MGVTIGVTPRLTEQLPQMPLTDTAIKKAKPDAKQRKLYDERGLFLLISPKGGKWWRFKYQFDGKEKLLSVGTYPDVSLKDARERRDEARKQVAAGIDPGGHRKAKRTARVANQANSFEVVAREWYAKHSPNWSANHGDRIIRRLERDIFPWLGSSPVADITAPQLLEVIRRIEQRGALETAHRALGNCGQVFRYAVATGRAERDPTGDLKGALPPVKGTHFAAVTWGADDAQRLEPHAQRPAWAGGGSKRPPGWGERARAAVWPERSAPRPAATTRRMERRTKSGQDSRGGHLT